jgi:hypothetical protein
MFISTPEGILRYPSSAATSAIFSILRPTNATFLSNISAAFTTCCIL